MDEFTFPVLSNESESWLGQLLPEFSAENAVGELVSGSFSIDGAGVLERFLNLFSGELRTSLRVLAMLLVLGIFMAILKNMQSSFGREGVSRAVDMASMAYLTAVALEAFSGAREYAVRAINDLSLLMEAMLPVTMSLMMSGGAAVSSAAIHPVIYFMCNMLAKIVTGVIIPLALFETALFLLDTLSPEISLGTAAELCGRMGRYILSFIMVIFTGVLSITRFATASFDSLAARGLKFAVSAAVPVVGGSVADAMNSVAGGSMLLKNSPGAAGAVLIISVALLPVVKIGALSLIFRIGGALMGPLGGSELGGIIYKMAGCLEMLLSSVASAAVMMLIGVIAIMGG